VTVCAAIVMVALKHRILRTIGQINGGLPLLNRHDARVTRRQILITRGEEYVHYRLVVCPYATAGLLNVKLNTADFQECSALRVQCSSRGIVIIIFML
jgi:hypothetical protein